MKGKHSSIQKKLMAVIMMTTGIVLVMTCMAFFVYEIITAREVARRHMSTLAQVIAANSTTALAENNPKEASETLGALRAESHIVAACLYDSTGKIFARYPDTISAISLPQVLPVKRYYFNNGFLSGFRTVMLDGKKLGTLYLRSDTTEIYDRFKLYGVIALVFIAISFIFAYFISVKLQKTISDPILQLTSTARLVSDKGNYSVRATKSSYDEVGELTDAFNFMLTQIDSQNAEITTLNQGLEKKVAERTRELNEAVEALKQQTEFADKIFDSTVDLIAVFDTKFRYVTLNKPAEVIYRISREKARGRYITDLFPAVKFSGMIDDLKKAISGEVVRHLNYHSPVTNRQYENFYIPLKDRNGKVYRILTIAHDITDLMQANNKLHELNVELEKSNLELEQFAYVASHDLQEPLRKIQTFSQLGEKNIDKPEVLKRYLEKVNISAQRMTDLIKAVLNYSRYTKTDEKFVEVNLNDTLENILTDLELLIEEKKAKIKYEKLPVVNGIPLQLHQMFLNLITNSLKFSDAEPELVIACKTGKGSEFPEGLQLNESSNYVMLEFRDNGIGFDQKFSEKIFSIFQRLHNDKNYAGTGIGLALCKKIVQNHHGQITVKSEPGKGTSFFVYLPAATVSQDQFTNISSINK